MLTSLSNYGVYLGAGDFSDLYLEQSSSFSLRWEEGRVETISQTDESGAGLRIINGSQTRFGHVTLRRPFEGPLNDGERTRLFKLFKELSSGLKSGSMEHLRSPVLTKNLVNIDPGLISIDDKVNMMRRMFGATNVNPLVRQVAINYGEKKKRMGCLNSQGDVCVEERTYLVLSILVTMEKGQDLQTAYDSIGGTTGFEIFDGGKAEALARSVFERANKKLDAPSAPAGEMPVVINSSAGGTLIHEAIGHSLEADAVLEGSSPVYGGKLGQVVGHEKLTVMDNPTLLGTCGSYYFDDEGIPAQPTVLIQNGVLKDYLFDRQSALRMKRQSNGHGRRESFRHRPIPRMSNTYVVAGPDDPKKIIKEFQDGFLVTKMGGGQVNPANGDFIFEVEEGFAVKNGEKTFVRGVTLLGNGPDLLHQIDQVGSDQGWAIGTCGKEGQGVPVSDGLPTIHIKKMVVGGV